MAVVEQEVARVVSERLQARTAYAEAVRDAVRRLNELLNHGPSLGVDAEVYTQPSLALLGQPHEIVQLHVDLSVPL